MKRLFPMICLVMFHCAGQPERWSELRASLQQPPLMLRQTFGEFELRVAYLPPWMAIKDEISRHVAASRIAPQAWETLLQAQGRAVQLRLTIRHLAAQGQGRPWSGGLEGSAATMGGFTENMYHLLFGLKNRIFLTDGTQRFALAQYLLDRNWGMGQETRLLLTFPAEVDGQLLKDKAKLSLIIQNLIPGKGEIRFDFPKNPIAFSARSPDQLAKLVP